jgi:phage-related protein
MTTDTAGNGPKPVIWVASTRSILRGFPRAVRQVIGQALFDAQCGARHPDVKPLKGFGGAGILEIADSFDGNAFRAVYTVRFARAVYVLHVFQKNRNAGSRPQQPKLPE